MMTFIHGHHLTEEDIVFPVYAEKCKMDMNHFVSDHREFDQIWNEINQNLTSLNSSLNGTDTSVDRAGVISYLKQVFKKMEVAMLPHLALEENTMTAEVIAAHFTWVNCMVKLCIMAKST